MLYDYLYQGWENRKRHRKISTEERGRAVISFFLKGKPRQKTLKIVKKTRFGRSSDTNIIE